MTWKQYRQALYGKFNADGQVSGKFSSHTGIGIEIAIGNSAWKDVSRTDFDPGPDSDFESGRGL